MKGHKLHLATYRNLVGPFLLLVSFAFLFGKAGSRIEQPVWMFFLAICGVISCVITFLSHRDQAQSHEALHSTLSTKEKALCASQELLQEAGAIYRRKIEELEANICDLEQAHQSEDFAHCEEQDSLREKLDQSIVEARASEERSNDLRASLHTALDELRQLRKNLYFLEEQQKSIPNDLVQRHAQLRQQFDEKALALKQTRRRLFAVEGQIHADRLERMHEQLDTPSEMVALIESFETVLDESEQMRKEIALLEQLLSKGKSPQKKSAAQAKPKQTLNQMLELQF